MPRVPTGAPFDERGGRLRGLIDLAAGHYPGFLFGLGVGRILPVFHFHETTAAELEPAFRHLAENGYRAVTSDDVDRLVRDGVHPGDRTVMLAFDDALASLWLVVGPLLRKYGLRAVTYAIPGRMLDAAGVRPTMDDAPVDAQAADESEQPFATWPELRALSSSGLVDVQSHTWSHSMLFVGDTVVDVVRPDFAAVHFLNRPRRSAGEPPVFLTPADIGHPLFASRSRMSDGLRFIPDVDSCARVAQKVAALGGATLFERENWRAEIDDVIAGVRGSFETEDDRRRAIEDELVRARDELQTRLGTPVRHICLPWGVAGEVTRAALERLGVRTAFSNRMSGRLAVAAGDDVFALKRLHSRHVFALPGRGRRTFTFVQ
jgi:peptidoglycan/xylan/chitin deacetylase (PgdA/CDA1 family)